LFYGTHLA